MVYLPDDYAEKSTQNWPVIVYLHSADARGDEITGDDVALKQEGLPQFLRSGMKIPFIVVAPLCPRDEWWDSRWSVENLNVLLDEILEKYRANPKQIYLTGWSMGGAGVWRMASEFPTRFAAIAPISGRSQLKYAALLQHTPVWAFHGDKDSVVPASESKKMIDALQNNGDDAQLTIFPNTDHDAWQQVYNDPKFYEWLLSYPKSKPTN